MEIKKAQLTFPLTGRTGVIVLVFVVIAVFLRWNSLGPVSDPELRREILVALQSESGNEVSRLLQHYKSEGGDPAQLSDEISGIVENSPMIYSLSVSKSLLSVSSADRSVVRVDYSLPNRAKRQTRYYYAVDSVITGWNVRHEASVVAYYLNFL